MARLQILALPEGAGDDRPPFILVVDQCAPQRIALGADAPYGDYWQALADRIGARGVIVTPETVCIPANEPLPLAESDDDPERAGTTQIVYAHERTRLNLCAALLLSGNTTWRELIEAVKERQRELADFYPSLSEARQWARHGYEIGQKHCSWSDHGVAPEWLTEGWPPHIDSCEHLKVAAEFDEALTRVRGLPEQPEIMDAQHEQPQGYLHGYRVAIRDAKRAARTDRPQTADEGDSTGRPTHPDGTPYRYHEIKAGGWRHCSGCRTWGQWTAEEPHECPGPFNHGPVVPPPGG